MYLWHKRCKPNISGRDLHFLTRGQYCYAIQSPLRVMNHEPCAIMCTAHLLGALFLIKFGWNRAFSVREDVAWKCARTTDDGRRTPDTGRWKTDGGRSQKLTLTHMLRWAKLFIYISSYKKLAITSRNVFHLFVEIKYTQTQTEF